MPNPLNGTQNLTDNSTFSTLPGGFWAEDDSPVHPFGTDSATFTNLTLPPALLEFSDMLTAGIPQNTIGASSDTTNIALTATGSTGGSGSNTTTSTNITNTEGGPEEDTHPLTRHGAHGGHHKPKPTHGHPKPKPTHGHPKPKPPHPHPHPGPGGGGNHGGTGGNHGGTDDNGGTTVNGAGSTHHHHGHHQSDGCCCCCDGSGSGNNSNNNGGAGNFDLSGMLSAFNSMMELQMEMQQVQMVMGMIGSLTQSIAQLGNMDNGAMNALIQGANDTNGLGNNNNNNNNNGLFG